MAHAVIDFVEQLRHRHECLEQLVFGMY